MNSNVEGLADFLLARISEDERVWGDGAFAPVAGQGLSRLVLKTRAECDAKRRIVEAAEAGHNLYGPWGGIGDDDGWTAIEWVLKVLALPYADHPDYREDWRPA